MACSRYCIASTKLASGLATALPQHNPREERRRKHGCLACGTAWLQKRKPQTFRLKQAPGLLQLTEHRKYFRKLINGIISSGYQVRWRIQNQAWFGLPQHRRRLIIVGSKGTFPLPPFPAETHGPPGSGLIPCVTIADALRPLKSHQVRFPQDMYHQPGNMRVVGQPATNPHANLAKVVTTSGKENAPHSGKRASTVRELAAFQGFPLDLRCKQQYRSQKTVRRQQCGFAYVGPLLQGLPQRHA
jgi:DNA (cytosine-5)-methyltransferase 1